MSSDLTHVFFDIGGVLGSNGWDREQRQRARERFGLDEDFEHRHHEVVGDWESGRITLDEYLEITVFYEPRDFTPEEFTQFMLEQSIPDPGAIALARRLAESAGYVLITLNNEASVLNEHRIVTFGLRGIFDAFLSSCWLGMRKPSHAYFRRALAITQADPGRTLFIDDREQNLAPAKALGMQTIRFTSAAALEEELARRGMLGG
jgi:putative hydrolase of the HAD superfamily